MRVVLNDQTRPYEIVKRMAEAISQEFILAVDPDCFYVRHKNNLDFIRQAGQRLGKKIVVESTDQGGVGTMSEQSERTEITQPPNEEKDKADLGGERSADSVPDQQSEGSSHRVSILTPKRLLLIFLSLVFVSLIGLGGFVYYYLPQGVVTLFVSERVLERSLELTVDPGMGTIDQEKNIIPGRKMTVETEETKSFPATGEKTVGEYATGSVEISNFTESNLQLPAGTKIRDTANGNTLLEFELIEIVTVPKVTETTPSDRTKVLEAGVAQVTVKATEIGPDYNLAAGSQFTVGGYDLENVFAENSEPIAGGSTEEVTIVSEQDQTSATEKLRSELFAKATEKINDQIGQGLLIDESTVNHSSQYANFSHEVGEETEKFNLTLKVASSVIAFSRDDVQDLLKTNVSENIPDGFTLSTQDQAIKIDKAQAADSGLTVTAKISTLVVPVLEIDELKEQLLSKRPAEAESILKSIDKIEGYQVKLWPALPDQLRVFPHIKDRLTIEVKVANQDE